MIASRIKIDQSVLQLKIYWPITTKGQCHLDVGINRLHIKPIAVRMDSGFIAAHQILLEHMQGGGSIITSDKLLKQVPATDWGAAKRDRLAAGHGSTNQSSWK